MKWRCAIVAFCILLIGLLGLAVVAEENVFVFAIDTAPYSLDPHVNDYGYSKALQDGVYESLVELRLNENHTVEVYPALAESWSVSEDQMCYTFKLRDGVTFHDGSPLTAEAVVYSFDRVMALASVPSGLFTGIEFSVTAMDEQTIRFDLTNPVGEVLNRIAGVRIVSQAAAQANESEGNWGKAWFEQHTDGTGPFVLEEYEPQSRYVLTRFKNYWKGWEGQHPEKIVGLIIPDENTRAELLLNGEVDWVYGMSLPTILDELDAAEEVVVRRSYAGSTLFILMRNRGALADRRVRKAISLTVDYTKFWAEVGGGHGSAANGPLGPIYFGWNADLRTLGKNIDRAQRLMVEAGYPDGISEPLKIWVISSYLPIEIPVAEALQEGCRQIGITLEIQDFASAGTYLDGVFVSDVNEGPDMSAWTEETVTGSPSRILELFCGNQWPPAGRNAMFYKNEVFDDVFQKATSAPDEEREMLIQLLQAILVADMPAIPFGFRNTYYAQRSDIRGLDLILGNIRVVDGFYNVNRE